MNLQQFFEHWQIIENPFRGEEARTDSVFARIGLATQTRGPSATTGPSVVTSNSTPQPDPPRGPASSSAQPAADARLTAAAPFHSDFEKILGDLARPSTAIVFGEKGSGKTAIRLQAADRIAQHNHTSPNSKVLLAAYDELNGVLDRFHRRVAGKTPLDSLQKLRLADHIDAILGQLVPRLVTTLLHKPETGKPGPAPGELMDLGTDPRKLARRLDIDDKRSLLLLQAIYDRPESADLRTARLRKALRVPLPRSVVAWNIAATLGWVPAAAVLAWSLSQPGERLAWNAASYAFLVLLGLWLVVLAKRVIWDKLAMISVGHKLRRQIRVQTRSDASYARSLAQLDPIARDPSHLPIGESDSADEARFAMVDRLLRSIRHFGYSGVVVIVDRVDEPTLVSGDAERMKAVVWPMLNNKFLQAPGLGVKMLLPIELRHALFKESAAFFQEARLDKQSMVERLTWTGAMLYDLCDARLKACRAPGAPPISLMDLFEQDVQTKDVVDALDQMHQPRDAFKFLYACLNEHCSNVTAEQGQFKVPRLVLETVRKQQSDRVQQLYRGIRPA